MNTIHSTEGMKARSHHQTNKLKHKLISPSEAKMALPNNPITIQKYTSKPHLQHTLTGFNIKGWKFLQLCEML